MSKTTWAYFSNYSVYSAMFVYTLAFFTNAYALAWGKSKIEKATRIATALTILATAILFIGVVARGMSAGRVPWSNMYEFSITGSFAFSLAYLMAMRKYDLKWLGVFITFVVLITLGTAITLLYRPTAPLVPALKSTWLVIHVSAAIISGGVFLLASVISATYLILDKYGDNRPEWAKRIPSLEVLDQLSYRLIAFVFPLWTFAVIAGAIWAESAWGRYWGWDPKETWAFITWVAYAAYLHARVTIGWKGRKAAWLCLLAGSTFIFNYVWVNIWGTGKHTYAGLKK